MSINDISFYVFTLPMIDIAISFSQFVLLVAIVGALIGHFIYGGVAWGQESGLEVTRSARRHLGILAAIYVLLLGEIGRASCRERVWGTVREVVVTESGDT